MPCDSNWELDSESVDFLLCLHAEGRLLSSSIPHAEAGVVGGCHYHIVHLGHKVNRMRGVLMLPDLSHLLGLQVPQHDLAIPLRNEYPGWPQIPRQPKRRCLQHLLSLLPIVPTLVKLIYRNFTAPVTHGKHWWVYVKLHWAPLKRYHSVVRWRHKLTILCSILA
jgi:hypothetical protein